MGQEARKDLFTGYSRADWQQAEPSADRSFVDVCIVCALAEEAQAFLRMVEECCRLSWTNEVSHRYGYDYRLATLPNVKGEPLRVHVSWLSRYGPQEMLCHLSDVIEECQPRFAGMTGICAGDKRLVHLGDLVVAERTFSYDSGKVVRGARGQALHQHDMIIHQVYENTLGFLRLFDQWKPSVAALSRPFSKRQQRDWLLQRLFAEPTGSVKAIPLAELEEHASAWRQLVHELQQGSEPFLSPECILRDKAMIERLHYGLVPFPFQDPPEALCHICPLASGSVVRGDDPFKEIQLLLRGAVALDMEGAAFGRVMEMERFRGIEWLIVKGVSDYADQDKDDSYHPYAANASAIYMLHFIEAYVTRERFPMPRGDQNTRRDRPPQVWNVPHPRNPLFIGRDELLTRLSTALPTGQTTVLSRPQAISGLGGVGKTQIAVEYAYQHRQEYQTVLWMLADNRESLVSSSVAIIELLNLPEKDEQDQAVIVKAVLHWLTTHSKWLLILDSADDLAVVREFLSSAFSGHILLTTRAQAMGRLANRIEVDSMSQEIGALFLLRRAKLLASDAPLEDAVASDVTTAREICTELGGLPLALDQAGAYIEETQGRLLDYQQRYRTRKALLLKRRGDLVDEHPEPVATTWSLSFEKVEQKCPAAADLLRLCAFLSSDAIPEEIITQGSAHLGALLQPVACDPLLLDEAISALGAYSLISRDATEKTFSIHRLVQAVLKDAMDMVAQRDWAQRAVLVMNEVFLGVKFTIWQQCERCLPHALTCAELIGQENIMLLEAASLLSRIGSYLDNRGRYSEADPLYERALAIYEQQLGPEHLNTAVCLNDLAVLRYAQGKYEQAEPLYVRTLAIREQQLGPEHPDTATSLNNLAALYRAQEKYEQAESLYTRALSIWEQQLGAAHPNTANSLNNLAVLYEVQGKYEQAERLYERALVIREQQLGPDHPDTAQSLYDLALLYHNQGKYEQAEPLHERALAIRERQLGPEHPDTARSLNSSALLYHNQGKHVEAERLYLRALAICKQRLGETHPHTAQCLNNLAALYGSQGKHVEAERLYLRALAICEQRLEPEHPHTAQCLNNLAALYGSQGKHVEAERLYLRALAICEQRLGPEHPDTAISLNDLALLYYSQEQYEQAEPLVKRALAICERRLGPGHPQTQVIGENFASLLVAMGREAEVIEEETRRMTMYN